MAEYIEREALREVVTHLRFGKHLNKDAALNLMERAIDNLPPADVVERKCGEWIDDTFCSNCRWYAEDADGHIIMSFGNFCPNCGADMRGESDG